MKNIIFYVCRKIARYKLVHTEKLKTFRAPSLKINVYSPISIAWTGIFILLSLIFPFIVFDFYSDFNSHKGIHLSFHCFSWNKVLFIYYIIFRVV